MCVANKVSHRYDEQQQMMTRDQKRPDKWERGIRGRHSPSKIRKWRTRAVALVRWAHSGVVVGIGSLCKHREDHQLRSGGVGTIYKNTYHHP